MKKPLRIASNPVGKGWEVGPADQTLLFPENLHSAKFSREAAPGKIVKVMVPMLAVTLRVRVIVMVRVRLIIVIKMVVPRIINVIRLGELLLEDRTNTEM